MRTLSSFILNWFGFLSSTWSFCFLDSKNCSLASSSGSVPWYVNPCPRMIASRASLYVLTDSSKKFGNVNFYFSSLWSSCNYLSDIFSWLILNNSFFYLSHFNHFQNWLREGKKSKNGSFASGCKSLTLLLPIRISSGRS